MEGKLSDQLERWLEGDEPRTLGGLIDLFAERSFAVLFVLLLAVPALPLPTGGVTHVFEAIAILLALELIVGRRQVWLPARLRGRELGPVTQRRFSDVLLSRIRWLERHSRSRLEFLLTNRLAGVAYGATVLALTLTAFLAPPFTGLDTLPSLGVVVISVGMLVGDSLLVLAGLVIGAVGVALVIVLGGAAIRGLSGLL